MPDGETPPRAALVAATRRLSPNERAAKATRLRNMALVAERDGDPEADGLEIGHMLRRYAADIENAWPPR